MLPSPREIFSAFEKGEIEREELHAMMALHARELIGEMEEDLQNPAAAFVERLLARRLARRLVRRHGGRLVREVLLTLSEAAEFPAARHWWNAAHPDVPLYCFFRMRKLPILRITAIKPLGEAFQVEVEHGGSGNSKVLKQSFLLQRDEGFRLRVVR